MAVLDQLLCDKEKARIKVAAVVFKMQFSTGSRRLTLYSRAERGK